jgi:L-aspartate oxidase
MTSAWDAGADLVVVGTGVAGLTAALHAMRLGLRVVVITKSTVDDGNTRWAQGGVAAVLPGQHDPGDSVVRHAEDTVAAGAGLCEPEAVASILAAGPAALRRLQQLGAVFDTSAPGRLARTREGGHRTLRIVRAGGDATGAEVERVLVAATRGLPVLERCMATRIALAASGAVAGVHVLGSDGSAGLLRAPAVLLATGGLGQLYRATSNPEVATGDGLALALGAGAALADVEFVQFHPTVLYTGPQAAGRRPLVTEAVRGEGAVLIDAAGARVMAGVHPLGDLAPRDVVSAAIVRRLAERPGGVDDHVYLDATGFAREEFRSRFPTVYAACRAAGIEPSRDPIPVAPAAHYHCGGVMTDQMGRTDVPGLYAAGEVARTGLHGANRLASNSLLEGLVLGERAAAAVALAKAPALDPADPAGEPPAAVPDLAELRRLMSTHAAIGRTESGLREVEQWLDGAQQPVAPAGREGWERVAQTLAARAVVTAALCRRESRGCHVRTDFPRPDDARWLGSIPIKLGASGALYPAEALAAAGGPA